MYGNYGGWGGLGGFPSRNAVPNSQSVQSDQEFQNGWQQRLDAIPQYLQSGNITRTSDWQANQQRPFMGAPGGPGVQSMTAGQDYGQGSAGGVGTQSVTQDSNNGFRPMAVGGFGTQSVKRDNPDGITQVANPEWARVNQMMQDATSQRSENQMRQQQAYDFGMLGGNDRNGLLNANYSQPGYGQISGQDQSAAFGADGGTQLGGVNDQFITGAYTPSNSGATYNPNPYSAQNFQPKGWGL
jgi:hypothetical protein